MNAAVVFAHGLATSAARTWRETGWLDLVADSGRTPVAPDLLGHGEKPAPLEPSAYDATEEVFFADLPEGDKDAVGFSLGARTLLCTEIAHPGTFDRIVLAGVGDNLLREDEGTSRRLADMLEAGNLEEPVVAYFAQMATASGQSLDVLSAILRRPNPPRLTPELLSTIDSDVLIVIGEDDFAGPADLLSRSIEGSKLAVLAGVDHFATPKSMGFLDAGLEFLGIQVY